MLRNTPKDLTLGIDQKKKQKNTCIPEKKDTTHWTTLWKYRYNKTENKHGQNLKKLTIKGTTMAATMSLKYDI